MNPLPAANGEITEAEIRELVEHLPSAVRREVERAFFEFNTLMSVSGCKRSWRECVENDFAVEMLLGDFNALDKNGDVDFKCEVLLVDPLLFHRLGRAMRALSRAFRFIQAPAEDFLSDSVQQFSFIRSQTQASLLAINPRQTKAAEQSAQLSKFANEVLSNIKSDVNTKSIRWLVAEIQTAWSNRGPEHVSPPSRSTLTPIVCALLPGHPRINPKK